LVKARERQFQYEQVIADCMAKQGFAYTPWVDPVDASRVLAEAPPTGTLEYAKEYGCGIASNPLSEMLSNPSANPNDTYKDGLSPAARYAFNVAFMGKNAADIERGIEENDPIPKTNTPPPDDGGGCRGEGNRVVYPAGDGDQAASDLYSSAKLAVSGADTDPRVISALQKWSDCMVSAGYPRYSARLDLYNQYSSEFAAADRSDSSAIAAFKANEIRAGVDDATCADSSGYTEIHNDVRDEIERKFIADHQAELDAFVAEYGDR